MEKNPTSAKATAGSKTAKYLKYAIGEIVLVMIGILLALQVNNWNNNRAERKLESDILNEILLNLETDIKNIEIKQKENDSYIEYNSRVIEHLKNKTPLTDSLRYDYANLYGHGNFQPIQVGYENLKSRGLNLVKNQTLRKKISELYEYKYYYMVDNVRQAIINVQRQHTDELMEKFNVEEPYVSAEPINLFNLQNDIKFQTVTKSIIFAQQWTNYRFEEGKQEIIEVKEALENELGKN